MSTRRPPVLRREARADQAGDSWSHWDLWFCLVCLTETDGIAMRWKKRLSRGTSSGR